MHMCWAGKGKLVFSIYYTSRSRSSRFLDKQCFLQCVLLPISPFGPLLPFREVAWIFILFTSRVSSAYLDNFSPRSPLFTIMTAIVAVVTACCHPVSDFILCQFCQATLLKGNILSFVACFSHHIFLRGFPNVLYFPKQYLSCTRLKFQFSGRWTSNASKF